MKDFDIDEMATETSNKDDPWIILELDTRNKVRPDFCQNFS